MIIVIDGYNVLKQLQDQIVSQQERDTYINTLKRYAKKKQHTVIVVFDGGVTDWQYREKHGMVIVIYSGRKDSADDVIKQYLEDNASKDLLLVTADRELIDHARALNAVAVDPVVFDGYVKLALGKIPQGVEVAQTDAQKLHNDQEDEELDRLMEEGSLMIVHKPEESVRKCSSRRSKDFVLSKKERKLTNKLKKL